MTDIRKSRNALLRRVLDEAGEAPPSERRAAFNGSGSGPTGVLVGKVARNAYRITDADVAAVRDSGLTEDEVFEIVVCAAIGQANRQYECALAALDAAAGKD